MKSPLKTSSISPKSTPFTQKIKNIFQKNLITEQKNHTNFFQKHKNNTNIQNNLSYIYNHKASWNMSNYSQFAHEGYIKNVIAYRCISLLAQNAANIKWVLHNNTNNNRSLITNHPLLNLLTKPNQHTTGTNFFESIYISKLISGNAFIKISKNTNNHISTLTLIRSDDIEIVTDPDEKIVGYRHKDGHQYKNYPINITNNSCPILHLKNFHPLNQYYGLSPMEAASYSIDQHNSASAWNQALLQNSARPSGALTFTSHDNSSSNFLTEEQYNRLKQEIDLQYSGIENCGKPILLEGGIEWKDIGMSPKDMDFIEAKHAAARDIALAFGVPPQLIGIPGDNTYNNMSEARMMLWEQTIIPMIDNMKEHLNNWLTPYFDKHLEIDYNKDDIIALSPRREELWNRIQNATFLSDFEKRSLLSLPNIAQKN